MKILSKHLHLSEDVCRLLADRKIKERRSESSIVDEILRIALNQQNKSEDFSENNNLSWRIGWQLNTQRKKAIHLKKKWNKFIYLWASKLRSATYVRCIKR